MKFLKLIFSRTFFMITMVIIEMAIVYGLFSWFDERFASVDMILRAFSIFIMIAIINNSRHLSSDMVWILLIFIMPVVGSFLFLLFGANLLTSRTFNSINKSTEDARGYYVQDEEVLDELIDTAPCLKGQFNYISKFAGFPFYRNTHFDYYKVGTLFHCWEYV